MKETTARGIGLVLGLALFLVLALTGCSSSSSSSSVASSTSTVAPSVPTAGTTTVEVAEEEEEIIEVAATEEVIEEEEPDPWADMIVEDGAEGVFLLRDGKRYTLSRSIPFGKGQEHDIGAVSVNYSLLMIDNTMDNKGVITFGPILSVEEEDEVIGVFTSSVPEIYLCPMYFYGHSVGINIDEERFYYIDEDMSMSWVNHPLSPQPYTDFEMRDSDDVLVEDYYNLDPTKEYAISWFTGTAYNEVSWLQPVYEVYYYVAGSNRIAFHSDTTISVSGDLTRDGYATYDFSAVEPGVYGMLIGERLYGTLIEIK